MLGMSNMGNAADHQIWQPGSLLPGKKIKDVPTYMSKQAQTHPN